MKIANWLSANTSLLSNAGIATPRLDCLVLLEDVTGLSRAHLLTYPEKDLNQKVLKTLDMQVGERSRHQPLAYIRGKTEFYGREFIVSPSVLEPRPESETMIDILKQLQPGNSIIDIGCGSGALGLTAKLEHSSVNVTLVDIDPKCLDVTKRNAAKHGITVSITRSDLVSDIPDASIDNAIILANLPYVPDEFTLNQAAMNEPKLAIFGGADGLDVYRRLFEQLTKRTILPSFLFCESLPSQHAALAKIARTYGYTLSLAEDFIQIFRPLVQPQA